MPFPWKKVKSARISQFVNDHLHNSQRRRDGSSLVVETGFPTSLVDLFMKNRQKLKKPSKKNRQIPPISPLSDENLPIIPGSSSSFPSQSLSLLASPRPMSPQITTGSPSFHMHPPLRCPSPLRSPLHLSLPSGSVDSILVVEERERVVERGVDANMVLIVVLKMFLVVIVALGTKRLTVGITISAFLLLLLEYVGKHAYGLLNPCSGIKSIVVQGFRRFLGFKSVVLKPELQQEHVLKTESSSLKRYGLRSLDREIQVVEPEVNFATSVDEIPPENEAVDVACFNGRLENEEIKLQEAVVEKEESVYRVVEELKKKSRRAKIKSKMKNLVPKKLRSRRKEHDPRKREIVGGDGFSLCDERQIDQWEGESESASELSSVSSRRYKEEDGMNTVYAPSRGFLDISDEAGIKKDGEIECGLSWRYLVLCVIVLIGLVGGRVFALLLTLSWLLLLKISKTLPMYAAKFPIIRSFSGNSV